MRKPHLLPSGFYLSLHCISRQDRRSEKPEASLCLCACQTLTKKHTSDGAASPRAAAGGRGGKHRQFSLTGVKVAAGGHVAFPVSPDKPASLLPSHGARGGLTLLLLSLSGHFPADNPGTLGFLCSGFANARHLFGGFARKRQHFVCPQDFFEELTTSEK